MFIYKGYRWTVLDVLIAVGIVALFGYFAINELAKLGISLASIAGLIWGFGTLIFIILYPFPIFGGSVEGEKLMEENRRLTKEEFKTVLGRGYHSKMSHKTIKLFAIFFVVSGGLTLLGIFTNT